MALQTIPLYAAADKAGLIYMRGMEGKPERVRRRAWSNVCHAGAIVHLSGHLGNDLLDGIIALLGATGHQRGTCTKTRNPSFRILFASKCRQGKWFMSAR